MSHSKKIAKNTFFLYIRTFLTMAVSLYTSRVILQVLGMVDFGIYSVVGGIVSFFSFLSGTMASATQRFFSFALGQADIEKLKKTFAVNWIVYGAIAIIALILLETLGLWFVKEQLRVPFNRLESVRWVYHFSVLTFIATIFSTPFRAIIMAHEDMKIYAYVSIFEAFIKLGLLFLLMYLPGDKLELYGMLIFAVSVFNAIIYIFICIQRYSECQFRHFYWDRELLREIIGFTGWTLFGQISNVARNQSVTVLLNQMFNPVVVASRAIAMNVASQINVLSNNFNSGLYPPIIKSYAASNKKEMFSLILSGSKISFFLMWIITLPLFLEMDTVLHMWLATPPPDAVLFTRLSLIEALIISLSLPIAAAARAPGKMRVYELTLGTIQIIIFFVAWWLLMMGSAAYSVFVVAIVANLVMFLVRMLIVRNLIGLPLIPFFRQVLLRILAVILVSMTLALLTKFFLPKGLVFVCISVLLCVAFASFSMYFLGMDKWERQKVKHIILRRIDRIF